MGGCFSYKLVPVRIGISNNKKEPHTIVCGHYVGITYFHGPSPGNYRRRK